MNRQFRQTDFLERMQQCIARYQPLLEQEFGVELGDVAVQPLRVLEYVDDAIARATVLLHEESLRKHKRPPSRTTLALFELEKRLVRLPASAYVWFRFWHPQLIMQWRDEPRVILVSFLGWSAADYRENVARLDQWVVHELAHGVWNRLNGEEHRDGDRSWRKWNEGFAHYLADIHLRGHYPLEAVLFEEWSAFRREARCQVAELVCRHGPGVLPRIPTEWQQLSHAPTGRSPLH
jgi:hypothetical protein